MWKRWWYLDRCREVGTEAVFQKRVWPLQTSPNDRRPVTTTRNSYLAAYRESVCVLLMTDMYSIQLVSLSTCLLLCLQIEELGIEPRLLEKWKERKELKKQAAGAGGKPATSRAAATLVVVGLSSGSLAWTKDRLRQWSRANGLVLAACIIAAAVAIACALILSRCSG